MKQNISDNAKASEKIAVIRKKKKVLIPSTMEHFVSYIYYANLIEILHPSFYKFLSNQYLHISK